MRVRNAIFTGLILLYHQFWPIYSGERHITRRDNLIVSDRRYTAYRKGGNMDMNFSK